MITRRWGPYWALKENYCLNAAGVATLAKAPKVGQCNLTVSKLVLK
jgi:hypothetical protein